MNRVPGWRIAAAAVVILGLAAIAATFAPIYFHNLRLQNFLAEVTARADTPAKSDDLLRTWVTDRAYQFGLPVRPGNVKIERSARGIRIEIRYFVRVNLPGYTVDLHFYPAAGKW